MLFRKITWLSFLFCFCSPLHAETEVETAGYIGKFIAIYQKSVSPQDLIERSKANLTPTVLEFINAKFKAFPKEANLPKLTRLTPTSFNFEGEGKVVSVTVASTRSQKFFINGKPIELAGMTTLEVRYQAILKMLEGPKQKGASLIDLILPQSRADDPARNMGDAALFLGLTIAFEHPRTAAVITLLSSLLSEFGICSDTSKDEVTCQEVEKSLQTNLKKFPDQYQSFTTSSKENCPATDQQPMIDPDHEAQVIQSLNDLTHGDEEVGRKFAFFCHGSRNGAHRCLIRVSKLTKYLCIKTFGMTDAYLKEAEPKEDTAAVPEGPQI